MKMLSAALAKRGDSSPNLFPRAGTDLRSAYDLFQANKGYPIDWSTTDDDPGKSKLRQLQDYYGLDIRRVAKNRWMLAGEWFGTVYVDYVADRFHAADRSQGATA